MNLASSSISLNSPLIRIEIVSLLYVYSWEQAFLTKYTFCTYCITRFKGPYMYIHEVIGFICRDHDDI